MAYCRFGNDSDIYMYSSITGGYVFHITDKNCLNKKGIDFIVPTAKEAFHRLLRLKTQGFKVPDYTIERMQKEQEKEN